MNSLTKVIESAIKNAIKEYVQRISSKYNEIDVDDLEELWNEVSKSMKISDKPSNVITKSTNRKTSNGKSTDSSGCPYVFIKGTRQDQTCGAQAKEGDTYCSRHKKYEGTVQKERKSTPDTTRSTVKPKKSKSRSPEKDVKRVLRKNKTIDRLWHPETGLVFRSFKERVVVGKCVDDKINPLTEDDIDECRKWGFSFEEDQEDVESSDDENNEKEEENTPPTVRVYMTAKSSPGSGEKFWECTISGNAYTTRNGKVGNNGTTKNKTYDTHELAKKEMEKTKKSKLKKGYSVVNNDTSSPTVERKTSKTKKITPISREVSDDEERGEVLQDPSDIENTLNELQGESTDKEEEEDNSLGKDFIPDALGLSKKRIGKASRSTNIGDEENEETEDEEMLIEEFEE